MKSVEETRSYERFCERRNSKQTRSKNTEYFLCHKTGAHMLGGTCFHGKKDKRTLKRVI